MKTQTPTELYHRAQPKYQRNSRSSRPTSGNRGSLSGGEAALLGDESSSLRPMSAADAISPSREHAPSNEGLCFVFRNEKLTYFGDRLPDNDESRSVRDVTADLRLGLISRELRASRGVSVSISPLSFSVI